MVEKRRKSWIEKRQCAKAPHVKILEKSFSGLEPGSKMLISSPLEIDSFIREIPEKTNLEPSQMRRILAKRHNADATCPVSTGIFLRVVAEAALEEFHQGVSPSQITPFWRIIADNSILAKKLTANPEKVMTIKKLAEAE